MPLIRRLPKWGFHNPNSVTYQPLNVGRLNRMIEEGTFDAEEPITLDKLVEAGVVDENDRLKILGDGEIDVAVEITAHAASKSARKKIEDAGGSIDVTGD